MLTTRSAATLIYFSPFGVHRHSRWSRAEAAGGQGHAMAVQTRAGIAAVGSPHRISRTARAESRLIARARSRWAWCDESRRACSFEGFAARRVSGARSNPGPGRPIDGNPKQSGAPTETLADGARRYGSPTRRWLDARVPPRCRRQGQDPKTADERNRLIIRGLGDVRSRLKRDVRDVSNVHSVFLAMRFAVCKRGLEGMRSARDGTYPTQRQRRRTP